MRLLTFKVHKLTTDKIILELLMHLINLENHKLVFPFVVAHIEYRNIWTYSLEVIGKVLRLQVNSERETFQVLPS